MRKKASFLALVLALGLFTSQVNAKSFYCQYARYNPTYAAICAIEILSDMIYGGYHGGDADGLGG